MAHFTHPVESGNPAKILAGVGFQPDFGKWPDFGYQFAANLLCLDIDLVP